MNDVIKTILERRSVRSYKPDAIPAGDLELIVKAGLYAPSANNQQPWHISVVRNAALMDSIEDEIRAVCLAEGGGLGERAKKPEFRIFYNAPAIVLVSGETANVHNEIDSANVAENIALAAWSLGLGSCIIKMGNIVFRGGRAAEFKTKLGVPDGYQPNVWVALGNAAYVAPNAPQRRADTVNYVD